MRVAVTGGSGKAGRAIVRDLLEHGYDVLNIDLRPEHDVRRPMNRRSRRERPPRSAAGYAALLVQVDAAP